MTKTDNILINLHPIAKSHYNLQQKKLNKLKQINVG